VILIDQLKEVYIDGELETIDTANWLPKVMRKDYTVGLTGQGSGVDPDLSLNLAYRCGGELNYNGYCNPEVDKLIDRQSIEPETQKRKKLVGEIERKLAEDSARPIIFYDRRATCRLCQGVDDDGQQHLQRLANGRCLARQINVDTVGISNNGTPGPGFRGIASIRSVVSFLAAPGSTNAPAKSVCGLCLPASFNVRSP